MTEGDAPEIPQHLKEGVLSVEAYEQQERRAFQIRDYARKLQIPQESMDTNATVYRYVSVLRDADAARERLGRYETRRPIFLDDPRGEERAGQVALLYAAEKLILEEGFPEWDQTRRIDLDPLSGYSLTGLLDQAAEPYGLEVDVPEGWEDQQDYDVFVLGKPYRPQPDPAVGLWTGAGFTTAGEEPWQRDGDRFHEWYWPDWPNERHDPEHLESLADEASRHGINPDRPRSDPVMHTLLTGLVYGRQMVAETSDLGGLPSAPGLTPPAGERLARVAPLNRLAVAVLEDAVRAGSLNPDRVATELESVVKPYGLIVRQRQGG